MDQTFFCFSVRYTYLTEKLVKLKTQLAIKANIEAQAAAAWNRKNFDVLLKQHREEWGAPQSLTTSGLIDFLIDNEIVRPVEIRSKAYDRKMRYVLGRPSPLQFALSFFKDSCLSDASALEVDGLGSSEMTYVNRERLQRISQNQVVNNAWSPSFYRYDAMGKVRQLTNSARVITGCW